MFKYIKIDLIDLVWFPNSYTVEHAFQLGNQTIIDFDFYRGLSLYLETLVIPNSTVYKLGHQTNRVN